MNTIWQEFDEICKEMFKQGYVLIPTDNTGDLVFTKQL